MLRSILVALALLTCAAPHAIAQPVDQEAVEMRAHRAFALWVQRVMDLLERTSVINDVFNQFVEGADPNEDQEAFLVHARPVRDRAREARQALAQMEAELNGIGPFVAEGAPEEYSVIAETILRDSRTYVQNMDGLLAQVIALVDAMERNDRAQVEAIAPRLLQSVGYLVEGQIVMLRARQQLAAPTDSAFHGLGAMIAMYEGMRAIVMPNVRDRAAVLIEASQSAARWGASGRAALARQRADLSQTASREAAIGAQVFDLEEQFYRATDRVIELLESAAQESSRISPSALNIRYMPRLSEIELRYQQINQQQIDLFAQLTEADNPL
jgi:hypothetical protein